LTLRTSLQLKAKASDSYIARLTGKPDQPHFTIIRSGSWSARANGVAALMRPSIARANEQLDPRQQLYSKHTTASINHTRPSPRKHSPDGVTKEDIRLQLTTQFIDLERMKGW